MDNFLSSITWQVIWQDTMVWPQYPRVKPLLLHYTSIDAFEGVLNNNELWLSNPLNMNDYEELQYGINLGTEILLRNPITKKICGSQELFKELFIRLNFYAKDFYENHVLDTYMVCFSEHRVNDYDGVLSMWRGYASNGEGLAFSINTELLDIAEKFSLIMSDSPILISSVLYLSKQQRITKIEEKLGEIFNLLGPIELTAEMVDLFAREWFDWIKITSLLTKHHGFEEEKEWRLVYLKDRDTMGRFNRMFDYHLSHKGVEPKLKLKLSKSDNEFAEFGLENVTDRIILGPTVKAALSVETMRRFLELNQKPELRDKVYKSSIPYRT